MPITNIFGFSNQATFHCSFHAHRPARALLEPKFFQPVQLLQIDLLCLEEQRHIKCLCRIECAGLEAAADYAERHDTFEADCDKAIDLQGQELGSYIETPSPFVRRRPRRLPISPMKWQSGVRQVCSGQNIEIELSDSSIQSTAKGLHQY